MGIINYIEKLHPKKLFLIDAIGGMITAFSLFVVLRSYEEYFGMSGEVLVYLSIIAMVYSFYSWVCYFMIKGKWNRFLRIIGIANVMYCLITMILVFVYFQELTVLGVGYFVFEGMIVFLLGVLELRVGGGE